MEPDAPGLLRYWFEFDVSADGTPGTPAAIRLDGGSPAARLLGLGAGVTGYDEQDCLRLLKRALGEPLPPLTSVLRQPVISAEQARSVGNPAWSGVWFPRLNISGPTLD